MDWLKKLFGLNPKQDEDLSQKRHEDWLEALTKHEEEKIDVLYLAHQGKAYYIEYEENLCTELSEKILNDQPFKVTDIDGRIHFLDIKHGSISIEQKHMHPNQITGPCIYLV